MYNFIFLKENEPKRMMTPLRSAKYTYLAMHFPVCLSYIFFKWKSLQANLMSLAQEPSSDCKLEFLWVKILNQNFNQMNLVLDVPLPSSE